MHQSHHVIYSKMKEYWRANLYDLVFLPDPSTDFLPSDFYAEKPAHMDGWSGQITREPLSEKSLVYIYGFIKWPEGLQDPIKDVLRFSAVTTLSECVFLAHEAWAISSVKSIRSGINAQLAPTMAEAYALAA